MPNPVKQADAAAEPKARRREADGAAAVDRALQALLAFREGDRGLTLGELSRRTGLYKSTLLRLLASLEKQRFVLRRADGSYGLGPTLFRLGSLYERSLDLRGVVEPALRALVAETGESASLYVRERDRRLCLMRIDSRQNVRDHIVPGALLPTDRGAAGRVLLRYEAGPGADRGRALVVTSIGERDPELAAVAAPLFDREGRLLGALCVAGTATRFADADLMARARAAILAGARAVTGILGGPAELFDA
ncbi:IclR family transcriptional regulator [Stella humosa]|uniref:IclR family transcriptional regulator n=1 Tax=Stella humosa TaxID=94 RepID=A0A3N1M9E4_9PROT|nr:IclR family transcriptional regulator [Stella humosa]ROQ00291.1 IclR family transcriptional regulator [Stella humosa]BBK30471.1 IclR family transcriptional regulator [Stella humosa]